MNTRRNLALLGLGLVGAALAAYARFVEPRWLSVRYVQLKLPHLPQTFHDYRIAQLSDLHLGGWMSRQRLAETVTLINQLDPDLVAITGDFVERKAGDVAADLHAALKELKPRDATVAVLGNHDYRYEVGKVRDVLRECGIIELSNAVHSIHRGPTALHIAGLDDQAKQRACLDQVLDQLPENGAAILLAHEPDIADVAAATERFDLQLSGHTHGGQVRFPLLGILVLPTLGKRYPSGLYRVGSMFQYTNRGLGMIKPWLRFNARPELTIFILEAMA